MTTSPHHPGMVRVARRSWVPAPLQHDLRARCRAVLASCVADTVVVAPTAARLHGFWLPEGLPDDRIDVTTCTPDVDVEAMTRTQRREIRCRRVALLPDEITVLDGMAVTSAARTWRDLAVLLGLPALVAAGDSALRLAGATRQDIEESVRRGVHVRGIRRARLAADLLDARSRSRPESHLRLAASLNGRLHFAVNEPISRRNGGWLAEPDLSLEEARLALEYQGSDHAEASRMRRDLTRFADLRREGWLVLAYGPTEVFGHPWDIESDVRRAVTARAPHLLTPLTGQSRHDWSGTTDQS